MAKANKLTAKQVFRAFKALSIDEEAEFPRLCVNAEGKNIVKGMADLAERRYLAGIDAVQRAREDAEAFDREGKRRFARRDEIVNRLIDEGLPPRDIKKHQDVVRANGGKYLTTDQWKGIKRRRKEKNARHKNNGGATI